MMETDRSHVLRNDLRLPSGGHLCECLACTEGCLTDPVRRFDEQEYDRCMGQTHVNRWTDDLFDAFKKHRLIRRL